MPEAIADVEVHCFLEALRLRHGIDLRGYRGETLRRRIEALLSRSRLPNLAALQHQVLHDPTTLGDVVDALTVQVSDMFRDPTCFRALRDHVLPRLASHPEIRIWHAGCSSGEEVYSMAIMLAEEGLYERSRLFATDISHRALDKARAGAYPASRAVLFGVNHEQAGGRRPFRDHVTEAYSRIAIDPALKRNIAFFEHNLVEDPSFGEVHMVLCRNVTIYLGSAARSSALATLKRALAPEGFLVLGQAEQACPADGFVAHRASERIYRVAD